jgi:hypothetical protein
MKQHLPKLLFYTVAVVVFCIGKYVVNWSFLDKNYLSIIAFFLAIDFLCFRINEIVSKNENLQGVAQIMLEMAIRLVFSMAFLVVMILKKVENPALFAGNFIALYLCNLIFEVWKKNSNLRRF